MMKYILNLCKPLFKWIYAHSDLLLRILRFIAFLAIHVSLYYVYQEAEFDVALWDHVYLMKAPLVPSLCYIFSWLTFWGSILPKAHRMDSILGSLVGLVMFFGIVPFIYLPFI